MKVPCIKCKGRRFCGRQFCPIYARAEAMVKTVDLIEKEDFFANSPPSVFVGRIGYPKVNVGVLSPSQVIENVWQYDNPKYWFDNNTSIRDIINFRSSLINSRFKSDVKQLDGRFLDMGQEIAMASKPVDIEVEINGKPKLKVNFDDISLPIGTGVSLKKLRITENPKVDTRVEKVVNDFDLKAVNAVNILYNKGFDENVLSKLLSIGLFGIKKNRKLVPSRWSITATDDTIGKQLINEVKDYNEIDYCLYFGNYFGNYYLIIFFPDVWSYELFETYMPKSLWNPNVTIETATDYEDIFGRKSYADETAGGYYAARLGILEKLKELKKKGSVLVLRFITDEYTCPLGVWVVRQATRKTLKQERFNFNSKEEMLKKAKEIILTRFNYNTDNLLKQSKLLKRINSQLKLMRFF